MGAGPIVQWWGHATVGLRLGGRHLLTDPLLTPRLAHLRRVAPPVDVAALTDVDAVLVSHLHADHLHVPSLRRLPAGARIVGPAGTRSVLARSGLADRVTELLRGDAVPLGAVRVTAVPALHDGRRSPVSRHRGPALGYVLDDGVRRVWFAGDTGPFAGMAAIGPVDVAVVPVGGWGPTLGPGHLGPVQAAEAVRLVRARAAVPMHFGTYWPRGLAAARPALSRRLRDEPGRRFVAALAATVPDARAHLLEVGGTVPLG